MKNLMIVSWLFFCPECWEKSWFWFFGCVYSLFLEDLLTLDLYLLLLFLPFRLIDLFWHIVKHTIESTHLFFWKIASCFLERTAFDVPLNSLESWKALILYLISHDFLFIIQTFQIKDSLMRQYLKKRWLRHPQILMLISYGLYLISWLLVPEALFSNIAIE